MTLLFHGTKPTKPHLIYATNDGFDLRTSNKGGLLGAGVYFSTTALYSAGGYGYRPGKALTDNLMPIAKIVRHKRDPSLYQQQKRPVTGVQQLLIARVAAGSVY